jgi:drug/metabolite transporter (DMT)-like permease
VTLLLLLPAGSALGYVLAVLLLKRALSAGCGQGQVNLVANLVPGLLFQLLWLWGGVADWSQLWKPACAAGTFLLGQICTFLALRHGEVSVATPLMGTKVLLTAVFSTLVFGQMLAMQWWLGAVASTFGVILVTGATWRTLAPRLLRPDALFSLGAAASFGFTDVLVQHWSRGFGVPAFVALMFGLVALVSLIVVVPMEGPRMLLPAGKSAVPLLAGSTALGVQALGMALALSLHESATAVNVVYSSRAVWSVVLAWALARFLDGEESHDSRAVLGRRLAGSLLLFAAVVAVLI